MDAKTMDPGAPPRKRSRQELSRGQGLVLFVLAIFVMTGFIALVIDVSWYWANTLRVQRAADSAALAGAVYLPGDVPNARAYAYAEATKNGYTTSGATSVVANPDPSNDMRLVVTVSTPVPTFFMRIFGIGSITASRVAKAEFVLPVPMGSPLNYFGVFGKIRGPGGYVLTDSGFGLPRTTSPTAPPNWLTPDHAFQGETSPLYTSIVNPVSNGNTSQQAYQDFTLNIRNGIGARFTNGGIRIFVRARSSDSSGCQLGVQLSWDGGTHWTTQKVTPATGTGALTGTDQTLVLGGDNANSSGDPDWWPGVIPNDVTHNSWNDGQFADVSFRVRIQARDPGANCIDGSTTFVDYIQANVVYELPNPDMVDPSNQFLGPQGMWTGTLSPGSDIVNGDPYLAGRNGGGANPNYAPQVYYDYGVEMSPSSTAGVVSIFDPVFCATDGSFQDGLGDHWYTSSEGPVGAWYDLYDTNNTPYDQADDTFIGGNWGDPALGGPGSSNPNFNLFANKEAADSSLYNGSVPGGVDDCTPGAVTDPSDGLYYHNKWWTLASGLQPGHTYRIRVMSRNPTNPSQTTSNALNNFSIFATAGGTLPRVYGLGSMVAFSPLPDNQSTQFFMAQIAAIHNGKTMRVQLYDPGDTGSLPARLQILAPTAADYVPVPFTYTASQAASGGVNCNGFNSGNGASRGDTTASGGQVTSIRTNNGSQSYYNGCWLTITIVLTNYTAPRPATETNPVVDAGWWKVRYTMGSGGTDASDLTTWKVSLSGNPVHLIVP